MDSILPPPAPTSTRGIIVLDTSALVEMSFPLSKDLIQRKARGQDIRLTSMLSLLAKNGYQIVIPEMVANECGLWTADGITVYDHLSGDSLAARENPTMFKLTEPFMRSIHELQKEGADIHIVPPSPQDTSSEADYLRELRHTFTNDFSPEERTARLEFLMDYYKRESISPNRGDRAAKNLIKSLDGTQLPIFYLTRDNGAAQEIAKLEMSSPVNEINPFACYANFRTEDLLFRCNLVNAPNMVFRELLYRSMREQGFTPSSDFPFIDRQIGQKLWTHPFFNSLKGLSQQLMASLSPYALPPTDSPPASEITSSQYQGGALAAKEPDKRGSR